MKLLTLNISILSIIFITLGFSSLNNKTDRITPVLFSPQDTVEFNIPFGWPEPTYDFKKSPLTKSGIELGRKLFYDPLLSKDSTIS